MSNTMPMILGTLAVMAGLALMQRADADTTAHDHSHTHSHDHAGDHDPARTETIAQGYFEDSQIRPRALSDWAGDWQSVYPLLQDGVLDPVMQQKAASGDKTAGDYRRYYEAGYKTDVDRIEIAGDQVTFHGSAGAVTGRYASDGFEVLTYEKGNRGVRFVFARVGGDAAAPAFIQFSDHAIAPVKAGHYHLYWGNDRAALLQQLTNWPTYYPASLSPAQVRDEMLAH